MIKNSVEEIKSLLKQGRAPLLPFEIEAFSSDLESLGVEQQQLGFLMGEAMEQSSETWHDNAPADAVRDQSQIVSERANRIIATLRTAAVIDYPNPQESKVTIGTVAGIIMQGDSEVDHMLLTGGVRKAPKTLADAGDLPAEFTITTIHSPLGAAILGLEAGGQTMYEVGGRNITVGIESIHQLSAEYLAS